MKLRRFRVLLGLLSALALAVSFALGGGPAGAADSRFVPVPDGVGAGAYHPSADPAEHVQVIVELAAPPVARVQADSGGPLSADTARQVRSDITSAQDALRAPIQAAGGRILTQFQDAYNGMRVDIARGQIPALARLPGVVAVHEPEIQTLDLTESVPFIGAPTVWQDTGFHGESIKVGIIDTGVDWTHANFAGPGTVAAYNTEHANGVAGLAPNPAWFGPGAPKVKGGVDLVGDAYNASDPAHNVPQPTLSPLDCNGHGSHVAGITGGLGVLSSGATYAGAYDSTTYTNDFRIGPGVAPKVDIYAIRIFGCTGSTNVTVDAINWAVGHGLNVINMSLGSVFGSRNDPSAVASKNAADAGIVVVASAGNSGNNPYIAGSPANSSGAISVAAVDSRATIPSAHMALSTGQAIDAQNSNGAAFTDGTTMPVLVLRTGGGQVSLGCSDSEYTGAAGKLVVTLRGNCDRVARAKFGQAHGAAAVAMIDTTTGYPPYEGKIPGVTIPFLGVRGLLSDPTSDGSLLVAADGGTATLTAGTLTNPGYRGFASFTSRGPVRDDRGLKPDISAPGVSINSTGFASGNDVSTISGTSQAAPHVAGVAALTRQAHPTWASDAIRAAVVNTGDPSLVTGFSISRGGSGLVQPVGSVGTQATVVGVPGVGHIDFGLTQMPGDFTANRPFTITNRGGSPVSFGVTATPVGGSPHTTSLSTASVTLAAGASTTLTFGLTVPAATAGNSSAFREVSGLVVLTPSGGTNNGVTLRLPYYFVPRARANVTSTLAGPLDLSHPSTTNHVTNPGAVPGDADFYALGLTGNNKAAGELGIRAVGAQQATDGTNPLVVMAINTWDFWSSPNRDVFEVFLDVGNTGHAQYEVVGMDHGILTGTGSFDGIYVAATVNLSNNLIVRQYVADARFDGGVVELPFRKADVGLTAGNPRFAYTVKSSSVFAGDGRTGDTLTLPAKFNAFTSSITNGVDVVVPAGGTVDVPVAINTSEFPNTPAIGLMVVTVDDFAPDTQATLIPLTGGGVPVGGSGAGSLGGPGGGHAVPVPSPAGTPARPNPRSAPGGG